MCDSKAKPKPKLRVFPSAFDFAFGCSLVSRSTSVDLDQARVMDC